MSFTLELFDADEISLVLAECKRVLHHGGRIVIVGMSKEGEGGLHAFEWTHQHFPNLLDCRPIFVQSLEAAGICIQSADRKTMWVPVEIVLGVKEEREVENGACHYQIEAAGSVPLILKTAVAQLA